MFSAAFSGALPGLPDPEAEAEFYERLPTRRFVAWVTDMLVVLAMGVPIALLFGIFTLGFGFAAFPLILAGTGILYRTSTIASRSATWGMRFAGIELRCHDGSRLDPLTAFLHTLIYTIGITVFPVALVSCGAIVLTPYHQSVSDLFLRTTAINRPEV